MNIQTALDSQLGRFESQLALLSSAFLSHEPSELVAASAELQSMVVLFAKVIQPVAASLKTNPSAQWRVKRIAAQLDALRQAILRNSVVVDRALATLMPSCQENTYAPKTGAYPRQPYGSAGRQSGEFRSLSA